MLREIEDFLIKYFKECGELFPPEATTEGQWFRNNSLDCSGWPN